MDYLVYILECADGTFYIGSTNDIEKRVRAHNEGKAGARYTRGRRPVTVCYVEVVGARGDALKREAFLKKLTRREKCALVARNG